MYYMFAAVAGLVLSMLMAVPCGAQITQLRLGGDGLEWAANDSASILIDYQLTPGAIQPVYLKPDRTVFSHLDNWSPLVAPRELGFVEGQRPRAWRGGSGGEAPDRNGTYLVDGDSLSYTPPPSDPRVQLYFTFDLAVPVPAFRFGFFPPPRGFRADGKPLNQDAVPAYRISIAPDTNGDIFSGGRQPIGPVIASVAENIAPRVQVDFQRQYVRYVRYERLPSLVDNPIIFAVNSQAGSAQQGSIGDFELYAEGVPQRVVYLSKIIDLGAESNFGRLTWKATKFRAIEGDLVEDPTAPAWVEVQGGGSAATTIPTSITNTTTKAWRLKSAANAMSLNSNPKTSNAPACGLLSGTTPKTGASGRPPLPKVGCRWGCGAAPTSSSGCYCTVAIFLP